MRGYWWAPDGEALLVARVDEAPVRRWHIADPANPDRSPAVVAYPAAGTPNARVALEIVDLAGARVPVRWDAGRDEYLARAVWDVPRAADRGAAAGPAGGADAAGRRRDRVDRARPRGHRPGLGGPRLRGAFPDGRRSAGHGGPHGRRVPARGRRGGRDTAVAAGPRRARHRRRHGAVQRLGGPDDDRAVDVGPGGGPVPPDAAARGPRRAPRRRHPGRHPPGPRRGRHHHDRAPGGRRRDHDRLPRRPPGPAAPRRAADGRRPGAAHRPAAADRPRARHARCPCSWTRTAARTASGSSRPAPRTSPASGSPTRASRWSSSTVAAPRVAARTSSGRWRATSPARCSTTRSRPCTRSRRPTPTSTSTRVGDPRLVVRRLPRRARGPAPAGRVPRRRRRRPGHRLAPLRHPLHRALPRPPRRAARRLRPDLPAPRGAAAHPPAAARPRPRRRQRGGRAHAAPVVGACSPPGGRTACCRCPA